MDRQSRHARSHRAVRRRPSRSSIGTSKPVRVIAAVVILGALLFCAYSILAKASRPYLISRAESREIEQIERRLSEARAENRQLKDQKAYLKTSRGKEQEARRLGWVKDGEVAIIVGRSSESALLDGEPVESPKPRTLLQSVSYKIVRFIVRPDR